MLQTPALSIEQFCSEYGTTKPTFYKLLKTGRAPRSYTIGRRRFISRDAAIKWQSCIENQGEVHHG